MSVNNLNVTTADSWKEYNMSTDNYNPTVMDSEFWMDTEAGWERYLHHPYYKAFQKVNCIV